MPTPDFGENGRIFKNFEEFKALLTLNICVTVISTLVVLALVYYLFQLKRRNGIARYFNKTLIGITFGVLGLSVALWILNFVFYYRAKAIFPTAQMAQDTIIAFLVLGFIAVFGVMALIWLQLPSYGVVVSEDNFWFLGETLSFGKITKIINDDFQKRVFINYVASARSYKCYRLRSNSAVARFLIANLPPSLIVEVGSQSSYFKELSKTPPPREK